MAYLKFKKVSENDMEREWHVWEWKERTDFLGTIRRHEKFYVFIASTVVSCQGVKKVRAIRAEYLKEITEFLEERQKEHEDG